MSVNSPGNAVTLAALLASGERPDVWEAIAVVVRAAEAFERQAVIAVPGDDPAALIKLDADGSVTVDPPSTRLPHRAGPSTPVVVGLGRLLERMLPGPGQGQPVPGALRLALARAQQTVDLPPFVTPAQLALALGRFERGDRGLLAARLHARWSARAVRAHAGAGSHAAADALVALPPGEAPPVHTALTNAPGFTRAASKPVKGSAAPAGSRAAASARAGGIPGGPRHAQATNGALELSGDLSPTSPAHTSIPSGVHARLASAGLDAEESRTTGSLDEYSYRDRDEAAEELLIVPRGALADVERRSSGRLALAVAAFAIVALAALLWYTMQAPLAPEPRAVDRARAAGDVPSASTSLDLAPHRVPVPEIGAGENSGERGTGGLTRGRGTAGRESSRGPGDRVQSESNRAPWIGDTPAAGAGARELEEGITAVPGEEAGRSAAAVTGSRDMTPAGVPSSSRAAGTSGEDRRVPEEPTDTARKPASGDPVRHPAGAEDSPGVAADTVRVSPDGARIAYAAGPAGAKGVYVADRGADRATRVSGDGYATSPSWAPDGRRLVFVRSEPDRPDVWNLWQFDAEAGRLTRLTDHGSGRPTGAVWLPDGRHLCYGLSDHLIVLDPVTGADRALPVGDGHGLVGLPVISRDGRRITANLSGGGVRTFDLVSALPRGH